MVQERRKLYQDNMKNAGLELELEDKSVSLNNLQSPK